MIGLLARSRSGKDTAADFLIESYPNIPFQKCRFAAPIKEAVCALYGFTPEQVEGPAKEVFVPALGISPRQAMVHLTKVMMLEHGDGFFSNKLFRWMDENKLRTVPIISDVRYEHDIKEIQRRGGIIVKIERDHPDIPKHTWEDMIDAFDADLVIENNGTRQEFYENLRKVFTIAPKT